jgi:hypothetical protein
MPASLLSTGRLIVADFTLAGWPVRMDGQACVLSARAHVDKRRSASAIVGRVSPRAKDACDSLSRIGLARPITRIVNAAELPAPQLGRILIAAGLLSEEQLAQALEEQAQTGRRLGEIIVQRGFISGPALANALAEQHGGVLKTEYGFASGLGGVVARRAAAESGTSVSPLRPPDPTPMPTLRTAEPQAVSLVPEEEQEAASEEPAEQPVQEEMPEPLRPAEPAPEPQQAPAASELAEPPLEQETTEIRAPAEPPSEPEQTLEPPPLLRPAEPPAPAFEEPSEPEPPPAAASPLSPPLLADPLVPAPPPVAPEPEPALQSAQPTEVQEPPREPERTLPAEVEELIPEPVELRPPDPEPVQQAPPPVTHEPALLPPPEPEATPPAEAAEPIPEPVELGPPAAETAQEVPQPVLPEPVLEAPPAPEPEPQLEPEQPAATVFDDRDELIESLRARVEAQELELAQLRGQLEEERTRKDVQVHVWPEEQSVPTTPAPAQTEHYLLCVPTAAGYVLLDRVGGLPSVGQAVDVPEEEGRFTVTKVVRLPRNGRPCAYLQRA